MTEVKSDVPRTEVKPRVNTALERLKKLDEERAALMEQATKEAKDRAEAAISDLNALGYNFHLAEGESTGKPAKKRQQRQKDPNTPCSLCKYVTEPPHDARAHRSQEPKKPFTNKELEERGFKKRP